MGMIGENIKLFRQSKGLTQEELAKKLGISKSAISRYESGQREPDLDSVEKIASTLGVSLRDLVSVDNLFNILVGGESLIETQYLSNLQNYNDSSVEKKIGEYQLQILVAMDKLNLEGQKKAVERVEELTEIPRYQKEKSPADGD